jgi:hypothetical protein
MQDTKSDSLRIYLRMITLPIFLIVFFIIWFLVWFMSDEDISYKQMVKSWIKGRDLLEVLVGGSGSEYD